MYTNLKKNNFHEVGWKTKQRHLKLDQTVRETVNMTYSISYIIKKLHKYEVKRGDYSRP